MVGHVAHHQGGPAGTAVVCGLVKAHVAPPAHIRHPLQVPRRRVRHYSQGQRRGVGRDHAAHRVAQRQRLQAEGAVLVVHGPIEGMIPGLRHAPGRARRDLRRHRRAVADPQQGQRRGAHQQLRHQVFKQRSAPGQQRRPLPHRGAQPPQPFPVARRDLAQQYGGVAEYARLGGQQIVVGGGEAVGVHVHADVEELPFGIVERREVHALRQRPQSIGERGVVQQRRAGQGAGRQVAAVHRGDVAGRKRLAGVDVDPVEDVPPPLRRGLQRVQRAGDAVQADLPVDDAQLRRRRAAQQVKPDVGGRRAPRRGGGRVQLDVVRRQRGVHGLEEAPGVPGQVPEPGALGV